jgi:hypothetical protein
MFDLNLGLPRLSKSLSAAASETFDRAVQTNNYSHLISPGLTILLRNFTYTSATMSGEKRPASESFNPTTQLVVKRQKSNSDLKSNAVTLRSGQNGTLVQAVCTRSTMH